MCICLCNHIFTHCFRVLLVSGLIDQLGDTPLLIAAGHGHFKIVQLIKYVIQNCRTDANVVHSVCVFMFLVIVIELNTFLLDMRLIIIITRTLIQAQCTKHAYRTDAKHCYVRAIAGEQLKFGNFLIEEGRSDVNVQCAVCICIRINDSFICVR